MGQLAKLLSGLLRAAFPTINTATLPTAGTGMADQRLLPSRNCNLMSSAIGTTASAAVGRSNPASPMHMLDIALGASTPEQTLDSPAALMAVAATKTYRLNRQYGGVAWSYGQGLTPRGLYLIRRDREAPDAVTRDIYRFDPDASPRESLHLTLQATDTEEEQRRFMSLQYMSGAWRMFTVYVPPRREAPEPGEDPDDIKTNPHAIETWLEDGTVDTERYMDVWGEGARPAMAYQDGSPFGAMPFILAQQGWLYGLRDGSTDPWVNRSFITMDGDFWPMSMDWDLETGGIDLPFEYLVLANPIACEVRWLDVREWDGSDAAHAWLVADGAKATQWKRFVAFDAMQSGGICALTVDREHDILWVLTNGGRELQRYDLEPYVPLDGIAPDNTPRGIVPVLWREEAAPGERHQITWQLLDMWGRPTRRAGAAVELVAVNTQGALDAGSLGALKIDVSSDASGQATAYYTFSNDAEEPETIIARIADPGGA